MDLLERAEALADPETVRGQRGRWPGRGRVRRGRRGDDTVRISAAYVDLIARRA